MPKLIVIIFAIFLTTNSAAAEPQQRYVLINDMLSAIPGRSHTANYRFRMPFMKDITHLRFDTDCVAKIANIYVARSELTQHKFEALAKTEINLKEKGLIGFTLELDNPNLFNTLCRVNVTGLIDPTAQEPEETISLESFLYVGTINYVGAHQRNLRITVRPENAITHIWLRIPEFCNSAEILEVLTLDSNAISKRTQPSQAHPGVFVTDSHQGGGAPVKINVNLNGPSDLQCDIPIYIKTTGPENPFDPDHQ
jgi:hypothetical protein